MFSLALQSLPFSISKSSIMPELVVHCIPYDAIGGVESAARSLDSGDYSGFRFRKYFLARKTPGAFLESLDLVGLYSSENDSRNLLYALLCLYRLNPRLLIASLWRSYFVLLVHKILHPGCKVVCFLHSEFTAHIVEYLVAWAAIAVSDEVWCDSKSTLNARLPTRWRNKSSVISFVLQHADPVTQSTPLPRFVFWGRLAPEKGLDRALHIFESLYRTIPGSRFLIIGPDLGEKSRLEQLAYRLDLGESVSFLGPKTYEEIAKHASVSSFYLQLSLFEGMAVSVVEAMQLGLVPVVTPVGEISKYCQNDVNSLLINSDEPLQVATRIKGLLSDPSRFGSLRLQAIHTWANAPTYSHDVLARCSALLSV
jgi:glycosyltransferase involved in cell wall biosynthesis